MFLRSTQASHFRVAYFCKSLFHSLTARSVHSLRSYAEPVFGTLRLPLWWQRACWGLGVVCAMEQGLGGRSYKSWQAFGLVGPQQVKGFLVFGIMRT